MRLIKLSYSEFLKNPKEWHLKDFPLESINLIVGKNATGKSRLINVINGAALILSNRRTKLFSDGHYKTTFVDNESTCVYEVSIENGKVTSERYSIDGEPYLERGKDGEGTITALDGDKITLRFAVPPEKLAVVAKRDAIQHPFLERLYQWGRSVKHNQFGTALGKDRAVIVPDDWAQSEEDIDQKLADGNAAATAVYLEGWRRWADTFDHAIMKDMKKLGYNLTDVGMQHLQPGEYNTPISPAVVFVSEKGIECPIRSMEMSAGMFRALVLTMQLNFWALEGAKVCMLIDDIGEGLDFDRARRIISLLIDKAQRFDMQLIMTTNDRFVMNDVPLKYWRILDRRRNVVQVISEETHPEVFEKFRAIGLNNFDFFSRRLFRSSSKR